MSAMGRKRTLAAKDRNGWKTDITSFAYPLLPSSLKQLTGATNVRNI